MATLAPAREPITFRCENVKEIVAVKRQCRRELGATVVAWLRCTECGEEWSAGVSEQWACPRCLPASGFRLLYGRQLEGTAMNLAYIKQGMAAQRAQF